MDRPGYNIDISHLEALLAAATPGPWQAQHGSWSSLVHDGERPVSPSQSRTDADLIVAAVNLLPALLAIAKAAETLIADDTHNGDANCMAGDCDDCPVHDREAALRAAIASLAVPK